MRDTTTDVICPVRQILTHEHPDLDAMLSVLLFRAFGEPRFPGAATADVAFCPAETLPDGKTAQQLEAEGIIALDIGGGRFDSHPVDNEVSRHKLDRCATDLVAETLGVLDAPEWAGLIEYTRLHDTRGQSLTSKDYLHHLVSLNTLLLGLQIRHGGDSAQILASGTRLLRAIAAATRPDPAGLDLSTLVPALVDRYVAEAGVDPAAPPCAFQNLLKWRKRLDADFEGAFSRATPMDALVSLKRIIAGFYQLADGDAEAVYDGARLCLDAIIAREDDWCTALDIVNRDAVVEKLGRSTVVTIASENGMVIRTARYRHQPDVVLYRNPVDGATSILLNRKIRAPHFELPELAARVRLAESVVQGEAPEYADLAKVGTVHGWFLHQSNQMLICGSPKATDFRRSAIPLDELSEIVYSAIDRDRELPARYLGAYLQYRLHQR